jgi:hypothetical protein
MTPFSTKGSPEKRRRAESSAAAWRDAYAALPRPTAYYVLTFGLATLFTCTCLEDALALMRKAGPEYSFVGDDRGVVLGLKVPATRYSIARVRDVETRWAAMGGGWR